MAIHSGGRAVFVVILLLSACPARADDDVTTHRLPGGSVQPQAAVDADGAVHLIYLRGEPMHCDIFYERSTGGGETFSEAVRVNSHEGSAVAAGTVRGAHLAVGRDGRVHVAWMG